MRIRIFYIVLNIKYRIVRCILVPVLFIWKKLLLLHSTDTHCFESASRNYFTLLELDSGEASGAIGKLLFFCLEYRTVVRV